MALHIWHGARRINLQYASVVTRRARWIATDSRNRLSNFWAPTSNITAQKDEDTVRIDGTNVTKDRSHEMLVRAGFLRQTHSGVFHLLPLGLRVQNKLENIIDRHMRDIGANKLSLSSLSTEELWKQTGRYSANSELLRVNDRKDSGFLLSPTHEEEITSMVASMVHSYKDLPLRLYQIGRKYRDERRPRGGLLRAKEFLMKDLYTFDYSKEQALETYEAVRKAYRIIFDELKIPYLVAEADSGNMGGKLSHEYHFVSPSGEDKIWSCSSCGYIANEEVVEKGRKEEAKNSSDNLENAMVFEGISTNRTTHIKIHVPVPQAASKYERFNYHHALNLHAVKRAALRLGIDFDTGVEPTTLQHLLSKTTQTVDIYDYRLSQLFSPTSAPTPTSTLPDLTVIAPGDPCPKCSEGKLDAQTAIEIGHTFHLGTRYSEPLNALVVVPDKPQKIPMQMGCHGIGVTRVIGAIASVLHTTSGLNWPAAIAPFSVVIIPAPDISTEDVIGVYDSLVKGGGQCDVVIDDRVGKGLGWKLKDADAVGYPIVIVMGKTWRGGDVRAVEVQCRQLNVKEQVAGEGDQGVHKRVKELLQQL